MDRKADRTSTLDSERIRAERDMAGFDDLPRDLRLLLHEHRLSPHLINALANKLRLGQPTSVLLGGRVYRLEPGR